MSNIYGMKTNSNAMHVAITKRIYKDTTYTTTLLRQTYREDGKVKHRTLANLSALPEPVVELVRRALKGETLLPASEALQIVASHAHGGVWAVLSIIRQIGLDTLIGGDSAWRSLVLGMIIARLVEPGSKRFTASYWQQTTLPALLSIPDTLSVNALYDAMDTLLAQQSRIESRLAKRHLTDGALVLYDLSSSYFEGTHCPLAEFGYSRDKKRGKKQFTYGLLTDRNGCPVAIEVFPGNTSDPDTLRAQITRLRKRYGFGRLVMVGDRGMITKTRIPDLQDADYDWITTLRSGDIQRLHERGSLQLSIFDRTHLAEIEDPQFPGERLVVCLNPLMREERRRSRSELLAATERDLQQVRARVQTGRKAKSKADAIGMAVGKILNKHKMAKHFDVQIADRSLTWTRNEAGIEREAKLDGIYVVRTSVPVEQLGADEVVETYKGLQQVEQAFRNMKTMHLELRPVFHRLEDRVRAHVFLCMLAYYVQWHMMRALRPLREAGDPAYESFHLAIEKLKGLQRNTVECGGQQFEQITVPTRDQQVLLETLGVRL